MNNTTILQLPSKILYGDLFYMPFISKSYIFSCVFEQCHPPRKHSPHIPVEGFPHFTWVNVMRTMYDPPDMGHWMYFFPGSGYRFNLGRTLAFQTHGNALSHLCPTSGDCIYTNAANKSIISPEARISARALELGYDSVQFTRFVEHGMVKAEVLFVKLNSAKSLHSSQCHKYSHMFDPPTLGCGKWSPVERMTSEKNAL